MVAPDHEYPSWLEVELTVTDSGGLSDAESVEIHPRTAVLGLESSPAGLELKANDSSLGSGNPMVTVIAGSTNTVIAPSPQVLDGVRYVFESWSDGGAAAHDVRVGQSETLTATYGRSPAAPAIASTRPVSPGNVASPRVKGTLGRGDPTTVEIFTNAGCAGAPAASGPAAEFAGSGIAVEVPSNASTALSAKATNAIGESPCSNSRSYLEDSIAPETELTRIATRKQAARGGRKHRPGRSSRFRAEFAIAASEPELRFECSLDRAPFARCKGLVAYSKLKPGRHRLLARATDLAGNLDASPAARRFRIIKPAKANRPRSSSRRLELLLHALLERVGA